MHRAIAALLLLALASSISACACRPGVIGPYGGRAPRCFIF